MDAVFVTPFAKRYQRNNKRTGRKNLRCFPDCTIDRHVVAGFCGRPVVVHVSNLPEDLVVKSDLVKEGDAPSDLAKPVGEPAVERIEAWAQFELAGMGDVFKKDAVVPEEALVSKMRDRKGPMLPWMRGNVEPVDLEANGSKALAVTINNDRMGWHYHWVSNKHTCDYYHCLKVYLFEVVEGSGLKLRQTFISPEFQIYCRRRQRGADLAERERKLMSARASLPGESQASDAGNAAGATADGKKKPLDTLALAAAKTKRIPTAAKRAAKARKIVEGGTAGTGEGMQILARLLERACFASSSSGDAAATSGADKESFSDWAGSMLCSIVTGVGWTNTEQEADKPNADKSIVEQVAQYLLNEEGFTKSIHTFFRDNCFGDGDVEVLYSDFLQILESHLFVFLSERNLSLEDFEKEVEAESTTEKVDKDAPSHNAFRRSFLRRLRAERNPVTFPDVSTPVSEEFDLNGCWINTNSSSPVDLAAKKLTQIGYPNMLLKLVRAMFWRMNIRMSKEWLMVQGEKKLMSNSQFFFTLDGEIHATDIPQVVPFAPAGLMTMKYRAFLDHGASSVTLSHFIEASAVEDAELEVTRTFRLDPEDSDVMTMSCMYRIKRIGADTAEELASYDQSFVRMIHDKAIADLFCEQPDAHGVGF